jgi:DNA polymerase III subunit delta
MQLKPEALAGHLKGQLKAAYLLAGSEPLLQLELADHIRAAARTQGFSEREVFDVASALDWADVRYATQSLGLFASQRMIELRMPTAKLDSEGVAFISQFCANPPPGLLLLVTCLEWKKDLERSAWVKAIDSAGVSVIIWPIKRDELPDWLSKRARSLNIDLSRDAAEMLSDRVEGNLLAAKQELDNLAFLGDGRRVDVAQIEAMTSDHAHFDSFALADAAIGGDAARAVRILKALRQEGEEPFMLFGWLHRQVELTAKLALAADAGDLESAFQQAYLKWPKQQQAFRQAVKRQSPKSWMQRVLEGANVDQTIKGRLPGDAWLTLERFVVRVSLDERRAAWFLP